MMIDDKGIYRLGGANMTNQIITDNSQVVINQAKQIEELEQALAEQVAFNEGFREIYEVWAGSDAFIAETAPEAYQQRLIHKMRDIAARYLNPSQDLVNQMKADAVREAVESLRDQDKHHYEGGYEYMFVETLIAYAKQLEGGE